MVIPLRNYYRCSSGVCTTVVTRSMARRREAEMQTSELVRGEETIVDVSPLLDLPTLPLLSPTPVSEVILEEPLAVNLEDGGESDSEVPAMCEVLSDLVSLGAYLDCKVQTMGPSSVALTDDKEVISGEGEVLLPPNHRPWLSTTEVESYLHGHQYK